MKVFLPKVLSDALLECAYFQERKAVSVKLLRFQKRHVSSVYMVEVCFANEKRLFWIKVSGDALEEYRYLRDSFEHFRDLPQLSLVKPIAYLDVFSALVTEHSNGTVLSSKIKRRLNRFTAFLSINEPLARVKRDCYTCGQWLAWLHLQQLPSDQKCEVQELIDYVEVRLRLLGERSVLKESFCKQVVDRLKKNLAEVPHEDLVRVRTHGDFAPYNVLVSGQVLVVLDPAVDMYFGRQGNYCSRYEDVVHFSNFLRGMSAHVIGSEVRAALVSCFLKGYNDNNRSTVNQSSPSFEAYLVKYRLLEALDNCPSIAYGLSGQGSRAKKFENWFTKRCTNVG